MRRFVLLCIIGGTLGARGGQLTGVTNYTGMCDASGAVALNDNLFVVADDEDNKLRVYHSNTGGSPVRVFDTTGFLHVDPKEPEVDLEGAARIGNRIYWITSHGRNRHGKYRESRLRFFATDIQQTTNGFALQPVGHYYANLLLDLFNAPQLAPFRLQKAARLAPKAPGGFNIEGLSATPDGKLIIGFRNPIPRGRALLVPLLNPSDAIEEKPLKLGAPVLLDLGKRGVRSIALWGDQYIIIAGAYDAALNARIFLWSGGATAPAPVQVDLNGFNPEAIATYPGENRFQIFSDDGTRLVEGKPCKNVPPERRFFRAAWVTP